MFVLALATLSTAVLIVALDEPYVNQAVAKPTPPMEVALEVHVESKLTPWETPEAQQRLAEYNEWVGSDAYYEQLAAEDAKWAAIFEAEDADFEADFANMDQSELDAVYAAMEEAGYMAIIDSEK